MKTTLKDSRFKVKEKLNKVKEFTINTAICQRSSYGPSMT